MTIYRYKTVISGGLHLDCDLDDLGAEGWECVNLVPLYRKIPGSLGSEKGGAPDPGNTYVYLFKRTIEGHHFGGAMPLLSFGPCQICNQNLQHEIHIGVKRA